MTAYEALAAAKSEAQIAAEAFYADCDDAAAEAAYDDAMAKVAAAEAALPKLGTWNGITDMLRAA